MQVSTNFLWHSDENENYGKDVGAPSLRGHCHLKNAIIYLFIYFSPLNLRVSLGRIIRDSTSISTFSIRSLPALTLSSRQTYLAVTIKYSLKNSHGDSCSPAFVVPGDLGGQPLLVPSNLLLSLIFCLWSL